MALVSSLLLVASIAQSGASAPDCRTLLDGLRTKVEANYAGHLLEVTGERANDHRVLLSTLERDAVNADRERCREVLQRLINWYDDPHLFLFQSTTADSAETSERAATLPRRVVGELEVLTSLAGRPNADPIEGIWYDGRRRIAVIPGPVSASFLAVITASDTATLPVGSVVARIRATEPGVYRVNILANSLIETVRRATMHREGTLLRLSPGMWGKAAPLQASTRRVLDPIDVHRPTINVYDDAIIVSVPSHDSRLQPLLDSLVRANDVALRSNVPLIIDLRGNEGGSSLTTAALMPFLMDSAPKPRAYDLERAVMLSSPDQIYYAARAFGSDTSAFVKRLVRELRAHPGALVPLVDPAESRASGVEVEPIYGSSRVAVLIDRGTVSAAEVTVSEAQRSARTLVIGEPTAGALDYQSTFIVSFARGERQWFLGYPTITATPSLPLGGIRGKGIAPNVLVDWSGARDPIAVSLKVLAELAPSR